MLSLAEGRLYPLIYPNDAFPQSAQFRPLTEPVLNAYRVLLTPARPRRPYLVHYGDAKDTTRPLAFYDQTYAFLVSCRIPEISIRDVASNEARSLPD